MVKQQDAIINCDVQVLLDNRGDYWAAYMEPTGMTVYGATREAALARVNQAMEFFVRGMVREVGVERLRRYIDSHGVPSSIVEHTPVGKVRHTLPFTYSLEGVANA